MLDATEDFLATLPDEPAAVIEFSALALMNQRDASRQCARSLDDDS